MNPESALDMTIAMWIPKTEQEIIDAAGNRTLEETITFDRKREISGKNIEIAKDISAFANTSGCQVITR